MGKFAGRHISFTACFCCEVHQQTNCDRYNPCKLHFAPYRETITFYQFLLQVDFSHLSSGKLLWHTFGWGSLQLSRDFL